MTKTTDVLPASAAFFAAVESFVPSQETPWDEDGIANSIVRGACVFGGGVCCVQARQLRSDDARFFAHMDSHGYRSFVSVVAKKTGATLFMAILCT